ncbi:TonB-dependent receptor plug domain-containing protein, partial [Treponema sp.]|uniref:TonB-dependent receptor plug domain-containing protein n=1 Tax=Treponema sp. TaxID=166 RepID=UPI0025F19C59
MASVRTLPGVSFSGIVGDQPSIRGGEPREMVCLLDGMYTIFPWHWGGTFSIFNPSMIDTIKLSNGVFSARYGRASSGLLEATTITPDYENFHLDASVSTTCADIFAQVPFGLNRGGMLLGTHLTYLDPFVWLIDACGSDALDMIDRAPYIRDAFLKVNLTPVPELDIALTGFFGSDGIGYDMEAEDEGITSNVKLDYDIYQAMAGINVKYLLSDNSFINGIISYNRMYEDLDVSQKDTGDVYYTDDFISQYSSVYPGVSAGGYYTLTDMENYNGEKIDSHLVTGKLEGQTLISEKNTLCFGVEETFSRSDFKNTLDGWGDVESNQGMVFKHLNFSTESKGTAILDNALYCTWSYGNENDFIQSELGIRGEFINIWNKKDDYVLNFIPDICPRASVTVTPWRNTSAFERLSFTAGSGFFVSVPVDIMMVKKEMGLEDFDVHGNRAILSVLGAEAVLNNGWKLKLETYYRHYLSRMYFYQQNDASSSSQDIDVFVKDNGKGHVFGIDSMIEKKAGEKWDGYISYSFVYARLNNPANIPDGVDANGIHESVLDQWFYPSYHRFHTINLVSNWHFGKGWTFTLKGTLATGCPKDKTGEVSCYASQLDDGTVIQRYSRSSFYSDTLRTQISCPVDVRISKSWKSEDEKKSWEFYFALQDVFVNFYTPEGEKSFNQYTGKMSDTKSSADFSIGVPLPSLGFKMKF